MKHFLKFSAGIFIFIMYLLTACHDDKLDPIVDYRCQIEMSSPTEGSIFANTPVPVELKIKKNDPNHGKYKFSYQVVEGNGDVIINGIKLHRGETVDITLDKVNLSFIPLVLGEHKIKFRFENEEYFTEAAYILTANDLVFEAKTENLPEKILINKTAAFDLNVVQKDSNTAKEFNARIAVLKGKGYVAFVGEGNDSVIYSRNLSVQDSISTRAGENDSPFRIKVGKNKLHYKSEEEGENIILLQIENEYGYSQDLSVPLNVELPKYKVTATADSVAAVGSTSNFIINIEDEDNYENNTYNMTYRNLKNSGACKINNNEIQVGSVLQLQKGENVCEFTPEESGAVELEFIVKDKYNTTQKDTARFTAKKSPVTITLSNYDTTATIHETRNINFSVFKKNYKGKYYFALEQAPINCATVKINGEEYTGGKTEITSPTNTLISFIPDKTGEMTLLLKVYDDYDSETTEKLKFNVSNSPAKITVSNHKPSVALLAETTFNFSIEKPNYTGKFKYELILSAENSNGTPGKLSVNNKDYSGGKTEISDAANTQVSFFPSVTGEINLQINVYDDFGGVISENLVFSVSNTDAEISVTNYRKDIIFNQESTFEFTVNKPNFGEKAFTYTLSTEPEYAGNIKVNGETYFPGLSTLKNNTTAVVGFTPGVEGNVIFTIKASDEYGGEISKSFIFTVSNPEIRTEITDFVSQISMKTENIFNLAVSKEHYNGGFHYSLTTTPLNAGKIKVNDTEYNGGRQPLSNPKNTKISFTPSVSGEILFNINISDDYSGKLTRTLNYRVVNNPVSLIVSNQETGLTIDKETSFNFSVSKKDYDGTFLFEITTDPVASGTFRINGQEYTGGKTEITNINNTKVQFTPKTIGDMKMNVTVYDENGGEADKELSFNVKNSEFDIILSNQASKITYGIPTTFNFGILKPNYSGNYQIEILQTPENNGTIKLNGSAYSGEKIPLTNPALSTVEFTSTTEGLNMLSLKVYDELGGLSEKNVIFITLNPAVEVDITNHSQEVFVNGSSDFNFTVSKENYSGNFHCQIEQIPAGRGTIKLNGQEYNGTEITLSNPSNLATFIPNATGTTILNLKLRDDQGKTAEKQVVFSVKNTPIEISFPNHTASCILNNPVQFIFKATKANYPDNKTLTYSITPTTSGAITVSGNNYDGTGKEVPYSSIKNGLPVTFSPNREGECSLTFTVTDNFGTTESKTIRFTVANPELTLFLAGVNTSGTNETSLGQTYKFTYNVSKANYNDDFNYWITLEPAAAGVIGTSDVTPRSLRAGGGGIQTETGTIKNNPSGLATGEVRLTVSNPDYIGQNVKVRIVIRDKWNNEKSQEVTFRTVTSAIAVDVTRKNSIPVEEPYNFFFTVSKPGYSGSFKYQIIGWNDGDKLEISSDNSHWNNYAGGKFTLPDKDHTYVRYTPASIGTVPLRLFVYDDQNGEAMQEMTFDVKAPTVRLTADASSKNGYINEFIPFQLTANDEKGEELNADIAVDNSNFNGEIKFNGNSISGSTARTFSARANNSINIESGAQNKLEMQSRAQGTWSATTTATNKWGSSASISTAIIVTELPDRTLRTSVIGQGEIKGAIEGESSFKSGTVVTLTATPTSGWRFVRWEGDASGTSATTTITMNKDMNVIAVFEESLFTLSTDILGEGSISVSPQKSKYEAGTTVTLTATPKEGWEFNGWEGDATGTNKTITVTMTANKSVRANFRKLSSEATFHIEDYFIVNYNSYLTYKREHTYEFTFQPSVSGTYNLDIEDQGGAEVANWQDDIEGIIDEGQIMTDWYISVYQSGTKLASGNGGTSTNLTANTVYTIKVKSNVEGPLNRVPDATLADGVQPVAKITIDNKLRVKLK